MAFPLMAALGAGALGAGALGSYLGSKNKPGIANGGIGEFLGGSAGGPMQFQRFQPQQQGGINTALQMALSGLQQSDNQGFEPFAQKARQDFAQQTVPGLAERFTSMGSGSSLSSPAFASALGQAGANMDTDLAAQGSAYGMDRQRLLLSLLGLGLTPQFESAYRPTQPGFLQGGAQGLLSSLPMLSMLG